MRYWIGVASRQHVLTAVEGGFAQFGHGKPGPAKVGALWAHAANGEWPHLLPVTILLTLFLTIFRANRAQALRLFGGA